MQRYSGEGGKAMSYDAAAEILPTKCVTAHVSQRVYSNIVDGQLCGQGRPCMRDECEHCGPMNRLIDLLGDECERRGCTLRECIYD